jgi:hypothetical protein
MVRSTRASAQALVESALVLPFVVMLSLGVLQVVLYVHARDVLLTSVQEGARLAAEDGRVLDDGLSRAQTLVAAGLGHALDPVHLSVSADEQVVTLSADAALRPIIPLPWVDRWPVRAVARVSRERFRPGGGA